MDIIYEIIDIENYRDTSFGNILAILFEVIIVVVYTVYAIIKDPNQKTKKDREKNKNIFESQNPNGKYVDTDRYLNTEDDDLKQDHSNASRLIQKCDVCGKKSELSYSYCPYCGSFLLGDIVDETEK